MSEATPTFSLARASVNNLTISIGAMIVMVGAVVWGAHYLSAHHDNENVRLRAQQHAALITEHLSVLGESLEDISTRRSTEEALAAGTQAALVEWTSEQHAYLRQAATLTLIANAESRRRAPGSDDCELAAALSQPTAGEESVRWFSRGAEHFGGLVPVVSRADNSIIGGVCASFSIDLVHATIARTLGSGQRVAIHDGSGRILTQAGEVPRGPELLAATADVGIGDWGLRLEQAAPDHLPEYLGLGAIIALIALIPIVFATLNLRFFRTAAAELVSLADYLRLAGQEGFSPNPPALKIWETAALSPAVERIFGDLHRNREALRELSFTDGLTRLPNRSYFMKMFGHAFELAKRGTDICLLSLEISDFKKANDLLGNEAADELLRMVAETLKHQTRKSDFAGRLGVYNFAAIFYNAKGHLMRNRLAQLQQDFVKRQKQSAATAGEVYCKLTCGLTYVDGHRDERPEDTLLRADKALRAAKRVGGNHMELILPEPPKRADQVEAAVSDANALGARQTSAQR